MDPSRCGYASSSLNVASASSSSKPHEVLQDYYLVHVMIQDVYPSRLLFSTCYDTRCISSSCVFGINPILIL